MSVSYTRRTSTGDYRTRHSCGGSLGSIPSDQGTLVNNPSLEKFLIINSRAAFMEVDKGSSMWQLEPTSTGLSLRDCTTSTTSTMSTRSSYALISESEILSSFAASLASGPTSDTEDFYVPSPGLSSPVSSADEYTRLLTISRSRRRKQHISRTGSPLHFANNVASPLSSIQSFNSSACQRVNTSKRSSQPFHRHYPHRLILPVQGPI